MMNIVFDHLFQSTVVLAAIGLLTLLFRNNGAHVRHALWTAASLKFLVPFALLNMLGLGFAHLLGLKPPPLAAVETLYAAGQPFSDGPVFRAMPMLSQPVWFMILGAWCASIVAFLVFWCFRWLRLRAALRAAHAAEFVAPMPVKIATAQMEPGLVGIFRPVLLLPEGITERLSPDELSAVIAHEACHLRRRDNLWAALHMLVEAIFWFWPPVWWLGTRLVATRERACDEAVLAGGNAPETYAEGILKVCKFYVASPLACAAGVSGSDLKQRVEDIMSNNVISRLGISKKSLLAASAAALVLTPVTAGLLWSPVAVGQGAACTIEPVMATHTLPPYPAESQKARETGATLLHVTVARDGHASAVTVARSSGKQRLDAAAVRFVQARYRWKPLACTSAQTDLQVVWRLKDAP